MGEKMRAFIIITLLCISVNAYASPLTIQYKHDTVVIDNLIVDRICSDSKIKHLVKTAKWAINKKDYRKLILIGTEVLGVCAKLLLQ